MYINQIVKMDWAFVVLTVQEPSVGSLTRHLARWRCCDSVAGMRTEVLTMKNTRPEKLTKTTVIGGKKVKVAMPRDVKVATEKAMKQFAKTLDNLKDR